MAISINICMTRAEWAEFADWLDARYSPSKWTFYGRAGNNQTQTREAMREPENPDSYVRNTICLLFDGNEAEEFTIIKMFHETANVVSHGVFKTPVGR